MALANTTANIYDDAFLTGTLSAQTLLNYANDAHKTAPDFSFRHNKWCPLRECNPPLSCSFLRHMFWSTVTGRPQPVDSLWMVHCWTRREAPWQNVNNCRDGCMRTRCSISQQDPARTLTTSRRTERLPHPQPGRDSLHLFFLPSADIDPSRHLCAHSRYFSLHALVFHPSFLHPPHPSPCHRL